ncbi:lysylphosphatidylglycerol synthase transmembrane domain-containing protein [Desulfogranum marinum]|uniref:lysylphosphatidylglycerol synthase transmembrane domain-containing protein n=1 Tax=Desulfogranum marinum TaxID=453220 RepID=UPI0019640527|nr:lysylphosphatidylglycerol synthase transmembrane domain-containing protein [Desulfogranum marinum]MBM9512969.1 flippase-like domain-containing protein [Desulfogranum marinum]
MKVRNIILLIVKLAVSGGLIFVLYRRTPLDEIQKAFAGCDYTLLAFVFLIFVINTSLSAWKWRIFLCSDNINIPLLKLVVSYLIGGFFNVFLPSNIGGDSYRMYDVAKKSKERLRSVISVFADRLTGFVALVSLSLISSVFVAGKLDNAALILLPASIFILLISFLYMIWTEKPIRFLLSLTRLERVAFIANTSEKVLVTFAKYRSQSRVVLKVMLISFAFQFLLIVAVYLMAKALGATVPFVYFSAFIPLITLMEALPISIYGLGIRDIGYVFFFSFAGMSEVETRSLALLFLFMTLLYALVGGFFLLFRLWASHNGTNGEMQQ